MNRGNLVIGAVRGYSFEELRPFVVSLRRTSFDGDIVLLWNNLSAETLDALREHGVKLVYFPYRGSGAANSWSRFWPTLAPVVRLCRGGIMARKILKAILPFQTARFLAYYDFLTGHFDEYHHVLLSDVRDVLFQEDPFQGFKDGLTVFEEDDSLSLADEKIHNAKWVEELFGPEALAQIGRFPILCSGTMMGDVKSIVRYLDEFESLLCRAGNIAAGGSDQGVHNYLCRCVMEPWFQISKNREGRILTMSSILKKDIDFKVSDAGLVLDLHGLPVPVLHQYDRHPEFAASLVGKLAATPSSSLR